MATELVPIDVVDLILSFLHSDIDALTTCAQSHLTLSKLSKRYIYASITLRDNRHHIETPTDLRTSKFAQILTTKSSIANHVRSLTVACDDIGDPGSEQQNATFSHLDRVASLLPLLVRLTAFTFMRRSSYDSITWHSMPGTFRQAFLHLLHPPLAIKDIVMSNIAFFPMSLLNNCRDIRITLIDCEDTQYDKESTNLEDVVQSSPVPFKHLSIRYCSEMCLRNIAPWVAMHGLRSLEYVDLADYSGSLQQFLVACSNSLANLHLEIPGGIHTLYFPDNPAYPNEEPIHFPFTLASLRHLTQLTINTASTFQPHFFKIWSMLSPIPAILELISTACPTLKKISINIKFIFGMSFERLDPVIFWSLFIPLAAKCSSASISMHLYFNFRSDDDFSPLFADFKGLTPYVQNGVVVISQDRF